MTSKPNDPTSSHESLSGPLNALANVHEWMAETESNPIDRKHRLDLVEKIREKADQERGSED